MGKTTTSVNLAACLAVMEKKVLLVDCDPQANASSGVGVYQDQVGGNLYTALFDPDKIREVVFETDIPFLYVLPSSQDLVGAELELTDKLGREFYIRDVLKPISHVFDYVILDCPPSLGLLTVNALCAARELLVPLQCEYYAMEGIAQLLKTYDVVKRRLNPDLNLLGVVLTMFDSRNRLSHQVKNEVRRNFPDKMFETIVPRNVRLSEAPSFGKPVVTYDVKSVGAQAYLNLAKEVARRRAV